MVFMLALPLDPDIVATAVQGADVSLHMRGGCDAGSVLRLLRPPLQLCTAILRVAAQLERRQRRPACSSWAAASSRALQHSGADQRVQGQEQLERPALLAGAAARGQAVNLQTGGRVHM